MKFLVLGCNGMAGHMISLYLKEQGYDVLGVAKSRSTLVDSVIGNAMDASFIKNVIISNKFDAIINCIGLLNQFAENNKADATYLNAYLPHQLEKITEEMPAQIIHISTDCVFSGKTGQYVEDAPRDGSTFYARSKALGEIENEKDFTMRQSIVGPDINPKGIGLFNWFMHQKGEICGYTEAIWTGQTSLQLAKTIEAAAKERAHGLYNMVPDYQISKCDLLKLFNKYMRYDKLTIVPVSNIMRVDKSLKRTKFEFGYQIPDYEQMIKELSDWIRAHKSLYPHYEL